MIAADTCLNMLFEFIESSIYAFAMRQSNPLISADQSSERDALGRAEGCIPTGAMLHGLDLLTDLIDVFVTGAVLYQLRAGARVPAFRETRKLVFLYFALMPHSAASCPCHSPRILLSSV